MLGYGYGYEGAMGRWQSAFVLVCVEIELCSSDMDAHGECEASCGGYQAILKKVDVLYVR
jgi:hypothetical protein